MLNMYCIKILYFITFISLSICQDVDTTSTDLSSTDSTLSNSVTTIITTTTPITDTTTFEPTISTDSTTITTTLPPSTTPKPEHVFLDSQSTSFTWSSDQPYHSGSSVIVEADKGFSISTTISNIDIDGESGDYLLLKSGISYNDVGGGRIFTYTIANTLKYYYNSNSVFGYFWMAGNNTNGKKGYKVVFERAGNPVSPTTVNPTTENHWPTPSPDEFSEITVNLTLSNDNLDYLRNEFLTKFKTFVVNMANKYCETEDFDLQEKITSQNVLVSNLAHCPYVWVNSENCVQVTFSLPVILKESSKWTGYQLNADHLMVMWDRLAGRYIPDGFAIYDTPDVDNIVKWWAIAISLVTIIFIILLCFFRIFSSKISSISWKRRMSDTLSMVSSKKDSVHSLEPHYLQEIPKLFENEYATYTP